MLGRDTQTGKDMRATGIGKAWKGDGGERKRYKKRSVAEMEEPPLS